MTLPATTTGVSPPTAELDTLLANRARADDLLTRGIALIAEAAELTPSVGGGNSAIAILGELRSASWYGADTSQGREKLKAGALSRFDTRAWQWLLDRSRMADVMSAKDKAGYEKQLYSAPPPLTRESVIGTFIELFGDRHATWRRGVVELFQSLSGNYKSHDAFKVGKRLVISEAFGKFRDPCDQADDLERIICVLTGDEQPAPGDRWGDWVKQARREGAESLDVGPALFRWFKNGNMHIWIQRPDLVDQINGIIAEHYGAAIGSRQ